MGNNEKNEEKKAAKKSFLDKVREIEAEERRAALAEEAKESEERAKREEKERKAYEEKLRQERLELMKLKQGMISEDDIEKEEKVEKQYTVKEKISNFFYHYKTTLILSVLGIGLAAFLIYDYVAAERPDIQSMYIAPDYDMNYYASDLTELWSGYAEDYNGDGKVIAKLYYVPTGYADASAASQYLAQSDRTKLLGEFQSGNSVMIIGTKEAYQSIGVLENVFYDCRELFPDDPYAEELGYRLAGTDFKELIGRADMDDSQLYVSFRIPVKTMGTKEEKMQENFEHAVDFWRGFIAEHRVDGLELEPTVDPEPLPDPYAEDDSELYDSAE